MNYIIIGTAGHIDHGKSSLIKALNGFWGDSTKEEKRRGITIDLSFSYLKNDEKTLAFIDVPGHEKLTSTMVSGAYGFDACMVVVDASEGIMPQTREHLSILNFLHVKNCIVALSKCDLSDEKHIALQKKAIKEEFKNYKNLQIISLLETSIHDEKSIQNLKETLFSLEQNIQEIKGQKNDVFRYYVDRVFNIKGSGTICTGTVMSGEVYLEDKLWVSEINKFALVKNIQIHDKQEKSAKTNQRVALNLAKIKADDLKKGMLLTQKGYIRGFKNVDLYLTCKDDKTLPHNAKVGFHIGAKKINGTLLHVDSSKDFREGFSTFVSDEDVFCVFDDKCIISYKGEVIAGGVVINPINDPIKKRTKIPILEALKQKDFKRAFLLLSKAHKRGFGLVSAYQRFRLSHDKSLEFVEEIDGVFLDKTALVAYPKDMVTKTKQIILNIYKKNPHALISQKSLNLKYKWMSENLALEALRELENEDKILQSNGVFIKQGTNPKNLEENIQNKIYSILKEGDIAPLAPYNIYDQLDIDRKSGDNALKMLTKSKKVIRLEHNFFVTSEVLTRVIILCREIIKNEGFVDIKSLKTKLPLSRKYLIAYLEYLDKFGDIYKDGTKRVLK